MHKIKIGIIGLGYVGLPLARLFATKYSVIGFDINQDRIKDLMKGIDKTLEVEECLLQSVLKQENSNNIGLYCSNNLGDLLDCNYYIITVPTPVDKNHIPDLTPLIKASETIGKVISKGNIVIYESTVYPGATEDDCVPIIEKISGFKFNVDFYAGYSPERINPGDKKHTVDKIKKITSGSTIEASEKIDALYRSVIIAGTHLAPCIRVAEAAKVIENSQRDINIAFVNELKKIFDRMDIDTGAILEAASTKWNFLPFKPGLVGGHCIGVDPYYLAQKAQEYGYHPEIILAGRRINDTMGEYVASMVIKKMIQNGIQIKGADILILGITFKENCPDIRNTKVVDMIKELQEYNTNVSLYDPWANADDVKRIYKLDMLSALPNIKFDAVILSVNHKEFVHISIDDFCKKKWSQLQIDMKSERDKLILRNTLLNYSLRGFMYLFTFLSVPLSLNFLGKERYGVFETLLTMLSWASLANLGLGNGLRNKISYALAENKNDLIRHLIGATFLLSAMIIIILLVVGNIIIYYFFDFSWFFKNITIPIQEIRLSFSISFSLFCFSIFLDLFSSIALGIHKSYINSLTKVGNLALYTLFLFIILKFQVQSSLLVSSIIYGLATILGYLSACIFIIRRKDIWPPIFSNNRQYYKSLFTLSISFFILQITTIIFFSSDNFLISKLLGPSDVTTYSIINKVFFIIIGLFSIILIQIWNSTSDAFAKKDFIWIKKTVTRLHIILILFIIISIIIAIIINPLVTIWLRQEFYFSISIRILFVLYVLIHCSNAIYINILNGIGRLRWQTIAYFIASLLNIVLSYYFITKLATGYIGVLYSKLICITIIYIICLLDYKIFIKLNKE